MKTRVLIALAALTATPAFAQLARPNAAGAAIGHIHLNATDVDVQSRFWTTVGGKIVQREKITHLDAFVAKLQAAGIKTDGAVRNSANASGLRIVYITDPWGTEIEITEGLATTPIASR